MLDYFLCSKCHASVPKAIASATGDGNHVCIVPGALPDGKKDYVRLSPQERNLWDVCTYYLSPDHPEIHLVVDGATYVRPDLAEIVRVGLAAMDAQLNVPSSKIQGLLGRRVAGKDVSHTLDDLKERVRRATWRSAW